MASPTCEVEIDHDEPPYGRPCGAPATLLADAGPDEFHACEACVKRNELRRVVSVEPLPEDH